jgi:hypothetical protein
MTRASRTLNKLRANYSGNCQTLIEGKEWEKSPIYGFACAARRGVSRGLNR